MRSVGGMAGKTRGEDVGELTLSMLRGEEGNQVRELEQLVSWLKGIIGRMSSAAPTRC